MRNNQGQIVCLIVTAESRTIRVMAPSVLVELHPSCLRKAATGLLAELFPFISCSFSDSVGEERKKVTDLYCSFFDGTLPLLKCSQDATGDSHRHTRPGQMRRPVARAGSNFQEGSHI